MYGWRSQIGFIVPANNTVIEPELYSVVPDGVSFHFTKLVFGRPRDGKNQDTDGQATEALLLGGVDVIVYACMVTSLMEANQWEQETSQRAGIPAITAANAVKDALRAVDARSVALVCHYPEDRFEMLRESFRNDGFEVVSIESARVDDQRQVNRISTEEVYQLARHADRPEADAVGILATDLRSFPVIQQLEADLGKPVISTNQAILWRALQLARLESSIEGHGALLADTPKAPAASV